MTTSKIEKIIGTKEWGEGDRKVTYYSLEMDNGDKINIGKKKVLSIGEELTYEITDSSQEYQKAKSVNPDGQAFSNSGGGKDPRTQNAILYQSQLKAATELIAFDGWGDGVETMGQKLEQLSNMAYQLTVLANEKIDKLT